MANAIQVQQQEQGQGTELNGWTFLCQVQQVNVQVGVVQEV
jgi:hypothetical protein